MGIVTHQWRCRPVSLGQTCSEREEKKEWKEGKQRVQRRLEREGGVRVKRQRKREEKKTSGEARNGVNKETAACVVHICYVQHLLHT